MQMTQEPQRDQPTTRRSVLAGVGLAGVGLAGVGLAGVGLAGVGLAGLAGTLPAQAIKVTGNNITLG
jgi:hypothetical protein